MARRDNTTSSRVVRARERESQAVQLRIAGVSYEAIAQRLGMTPAGAYKAVKRALRRVIEKTTEDAEELRRLEIGRLDRLLLAVWPLATGRQPGAAGPDLGAVDRALRIIERRCELLGLNAPKAIDLTAQAPAGFEVIILDAEGTDSTSA